VEWEKEREGGEEGEREEGEREKGEKGKRGKGGKGGKGEGDLVLRDVRVSLRRVAGALDNVAALIEGETRLVSEVLEPAEAAIESYSTRYMQVFDKVAAHTEQARQAIAELSNAPDFYALGHLARVPQLGKDARPGVHEVFDEALHGPPALFPADLTRASIQQALRAWPQPPGCPLTLHNASDWLQHADDALARAQSALRQALLEKARLLHSETLQGRLAQGQEDAFIAALLAAPTAEALADVVAQRLGTPTLPEPDPVALLSRYLKKLRVRKVHLADFTPSKRTLERGDVDAIVAEFRAFLMNALHTDDEDQLPVIEVVGGKG